VNHSGCFPLLGERSADLICFTLKVEAAWPSEMLVSYTTTQGQNPEDSGLNIHCHENLKSRILPLDLRVYSGAAWLE
jgi:hypothetical protein